jgi:hypothetical protein
MVSNVGEGCLGEGSPGEATEGDAMPGSIGKPIVSRSRLWMLSGGTGGSSERAGEIVWVALIGETLLEGELWPVFKRPSEPLIETAACDSAYVGRNMSLAPALPGVMCPPLISMSEFDECVLELNRSGAGVRLS